VVSVVLGVGVLQLLPLLYVVVLLLDFLLELFALLMPHHLVLHKIIDFVSLNRLRHGASTALVVKPILELVAQIEVTTELVDVSRFINLQVGLLLLEVVGIESFVSEISLIQLRTALRAESKAYGHHPVGV